MNRIFRCLLLAALFGLNYSAYSQGNDDVRISQIKNDPDWLTIAKSQGEIINDFVIGKIDLAKFDFTNEALFLKTINMSKAQYSSQVLVNKEAAKRLIAKYNMDGLPCSSCSQPTDVKIENLKSALSGFQNDPTSYARFRSESLGIDKATAGTAVAVQSCCGFWYYVCCTLCLTTIETLAPYLLCLAYCVHMECCHSSVN